MALKVVNKWLYDYNNGHYYSGGQGVLAAGDLEGGAVPGSARCHTGKGIGLGFAEQAVDRLTLESYKALQNLCKKGEWQRFEPQLLECLKKAWETEQLKIYMHRKEHEQAVAVLGRMHYPLGGWESSDELLIAKKLETFFPEVVLKFYLTGLGNLKENATCNEYTRKAKVMTKVRRVLVEVLKDESRWLKFAGPIKQNNLKRPAFQQEFAKAVPG